MRFPQLLGWLCGAALGLVMVGSAQAQMAMEPFDGAWDFLGPQARGKVASIVTHVSPRDWQSGKLSEKPMYSNKLTFKDGHLVSIGFITPDGTERVDTTIDYDAADRREKISHTGSFGGGPGVAPKPFTSTDTATYDDQGNFKSIAIVRPMNQPDRTIEFTTEATPEGGKKISYQLQGPGGPRPATSGPASAPAPEMVTFVVVYDKGGHPIQRAMLRKGQPDMIVAIACNDHGDIETMTFQGGFKMAYEREYDAKGNWTKETKYNIQKLGDKETRVDQEMTTREIKYAD